FSAVEGALGLYNRGLAQIRGRDYAGAVGSFEQAAREDPDDDRICLFPVFVAYVDPLAEVALNHEHDAFRWVSFHEAMGLVPYPGQRRALGMIREAFVVRAPHPILLIDTSRA
ncbi:MAG: hypothetical protein AAFW01_13880, partial [Pseudomonadota bacterium]